ncbi:uncharacterized protein BDZ99DRAFT_482020 [Mytilinidion resinicola]|uniref:Ubiquitin-like domain-containing protein n=1 Tax=Mytilinidion resinicola TaxID=574789 RepID=A0A6A6Y509_9PEZI|nr:uncharacterized protein BDZ99DRAFT_482020 [Mytilinidion resinicola]KAF2803608.1 hypothetical protein BDZ99DRAFT_482020 [Mytilinidion resinicola]
MSFLFRNPMRSVWRRDLETSNTRANPLQTSGTAEMSGNEPDRTPPAQPAEQTVMQTAEASKSFQPNMLGPTTEAQSQNQQRDAMGMSGTEDRQGEEAEHVHLSLGDEERADGHQGLRRSRDLDSRSPTTVGGAETSQSNLERAQRPDDRATVEDAEEEDVRNIDAGNPSSGGSATSQALREQARLGREQRARVEIAEDNEGSNIISETSAGIDGPLLSSVDDVMADGFDEFGRAKDSFAGNNHGYMEDDRARSPAHQAKKQRTALPYRPLHVENDMSDDEEDISEFLQSQGIKPQPQRQETQGLQELDEQGEPIRASVEPTSTPIIRTEPLVYPPRRQQYQASQYRQQFQPSQSSLNQKTTAFVSRKRGHDSASMKARQPHGSRRPTANGSAQSRPSSSLNPFTNPRPVLQPRCKLPCHTHRPPPTPKTEKVRIVVRGPDGSELTYDINRTTRMGKVMANFRGRTGLSNAVVFNFEGTRVTDKHTAAELEMEDGDVIQVYMIAIGGCN